MRRIYHRQIEEVTDIEKTYQWLENAAQMHLSWQHKIERGRGRVYHIRQYLICRLCKDVPETLQDITGGARCKQEGILGESQLGGWHCLQKSVQSMAYGSMAILNHLWR